MQTVVRFAILVLLLAPLAPAQTFTVLYTFTGGSDGGYPHGALLRDGQGNFYGTTFQGGSAGDGVVFKVTSAGVETVLHNFTSTPDGQYPVTALVHDGQGLFGVTENGGSNTVGCVFEVNLQGKERIIHSFGSSSNDGVFPVAGLTRDSAGNLYGDAQAGGASGGGMVFKLTPTGVETVVHSFSFNGKDGSAPVGGLTLDSAGNLYGTTFGGGSAGGGTIFKINSAGVETILYNFGQTPNDGLNPESSLLRDSAGNLYGTTNAGGTSQLGTVFKLDSAGTETILHNFTGSSDGANPSAGLVRDSASNFYGTTTFGGAPGYGVIFKIDTTGKETILYTFTGQTDGGNPQTSLILDSAGNLYGTSGGGAGGGGAAFGTVFKLVP